ncbi:DUF6907 domain-containing protein [Streptomyces niveus]|uniref:DUF6907 domain-containing protein n=1 Tax=Streptomyces niveus TaxID=193462 RepID=UPI00363C1E06
MSDDLNEPLHGRAGDEMRDRLAAGRWTTIQTRDHGTIHILCPAWCISEHDESVELRSDTLHTGPDHIAHFRGHDLALACLTEAPFAVDPERRGIWASAEYAGTELDPAGLDELAAVYVDYAAHLLQLSRQLAALRGADQ